MVWKYVYHTKASVKLSQFWLVKKILYGHLGEKNEKYEIYVP
jgi:hypothetical protein